MNMCGRVCGPGRIWIWKKQFEILRTKTAALNFPLMRGSQFDPPGAGAGRLTSSISIVMVTSSPTMTPPVSSAAL